MNTKCNKKSNILSSKLKLYRKVGIDDKFSKNMKGFWIDEFLSEVLGQQKKHNFIFSSSRDTYSGDLPFLPKINAYLSCFWFDIAIKWEFKTHQNFIEAYL